MNQTSETYYIICGATHLSMTTRRIVALETIKKHPDATITEFTSESDAFFTYTKISRKKDREEKERRNAEFIPTYYTDGSYRHDKAKAGYAAVLVQNGEILGTKVGKMAHNQPRNSTTAEMAAVMGAIGDARGRGYKKIRICYDCNAVKDSLNAKKESKEKYVRTYVAYIKKHSQNIEIEFVKVKAHVSETKGGDRFNKEADKLARSLIVVNKTTRVLRGGENNVIRTIR